MTGSGEVTRLISLWKSGDKQAENRLFDLLYDDLRARARAVLGREQNQRSIGSAGLVHLAYMDMERAGQVAINDRAHFLNFAANVMRRIVVDRARMRGAKKRGGDFQLVAVEEGGLPGDEGRLWEALVVDEILKKPGVLSVRQEKVVEMLYFAGYSIEEAALLLEVSSRTVKRDFNTARARLRIAIEGDGAKQQPAQPGTY